MRYKLVFNKDLEIVTEEEYFQTITLYMNGKFDRKFLINFINALKILKEDEIFFNMLYKSNVTFNYNIFPNIYFSKKNNKRRRHKRRSFKANRIYKKKVKSNNTGGMYLGYGKIYIYKKKKKRRRLWYKRYIPILYHEIGHLIFLKIPQYLLEIEEYKKLENVSIVKALKKNYSQKFLNYYIKRSEVFARMISFYYSRKFKKIYPNTKLVGKPKSKNDNDFLNIENWIKKINKILKEEKVNG